jgi:N-acetylmuramic acid 6-phosphate etherase
MKLNKEDFLKHRKQFSLGHLTTESFHSKTKNLSGIINTDLHEAILTLKDVDFSALEKLKEYSREVYQLQIDCKKTLESNKVFISGCGATGRLALSIEKLYREKFKCNKVTSFMAGGDYALIRSVESFEDNFQYGERQLSELGFSSNDLLLGVTEGGETSFVIGSVKMAQVNSKRNPWFIYCNPDEELLEIDRSHEILKNKNVQKLNLSIGPMALSGSTRMQATTVQMIAVGFALLYRHKTFEEFDHEYRMFIDSIQSVDYSFLKEFIEKEASIYKEGGIVTYRTESDLAISILTDTTERSPTFSLYSFEKTPFENCSLSYVSILDETEVRTAWEDLLGRNIRTVSWCKERTDIGIEDVLKFDISHHAVERRAALRDLHECFDILSSPDGIQLLFGSLDSSIVAKGDLFLKHLIIKVLLNTHSTLVMGKIGRIESNVMSFVRPSNYKLIDRAFRYVKELLFQRGIVVSDESIIDKIFDNINSKDNSIVLKVIDLILEEN